MKTLEVLERVLKGKRVADSTKRHYHDALTSLAKVSEDWPKSGVVIDEWTASLAGYADATVEMWWQYVSSAGKYIEKTSGKYASGAPRVPNPCAESTRPKVSKKRRRYFSAVELVKIIQACRFEKDKVLVVTLIDSTARIGELTGLYAKDIGESWLDVKGKTGERRYRCDKVICDELKRLGADGKPIFTDKFGKSCTTESLKQRVRRVIKEAGLTGEKLGAHTLRHSGASLVAQETGSALAVKALLQHDNIDTSMLYIHDVEDKLQQKISPLRLIGEAVFGTEAESGLGFKQIGMGSPEGVAEAVLPAEALEDMEFLAGEFPEIREGLKVRPLLRSEDLELIKRAFEVYSRHPQAGSDTSKARDLMKRMLRKVR